MTGNDTINETYEEEFDFDDPDLDDGFEPSILAHNSAGDTLDLSGRNLAEAAFARSADNPDDLVISFANDGESVTVVGQFAGPLSGDRAFRF